MIKEAITSFFGTVRERLSNPLLGAFILSWSVLNWRIMYTILRPLDTAAATIQAVDSYGTYSLSLIYPAVVAFLYAVVYPWIKFVIFLVQSIPTQKLRMRQCRYEESVLNAKRNVLSLESDLSLIRLRGELAIEIEKLQAQDQIEAIKHDRQYQREHQEIDRENARRQHEVDLQSMKQQAQDQIEAKKLERQFELEQNRLDREHQRRMQEIKMQDAKLRQNQ